MPITAGVDAKLPNHFKTDQCSAMCVNPMECCFIYCCMPCAVFVQRKKLLDITKEPYVMCAGTCPCCGFEKPMNETCLFLEACCCSGAALAGNKFMAQTRFGFKNDTFDNMLMIFNPCIDAGFQFFLLSSLVKVFAKKNFQSSSCT